MLTFEQTTMETSVIEVDGQLYRVTRLWGPPLYGSVCPQLLCQASGYLTHKEMYEYFVKQNDEV